MGIQLRFYLKFHVSAVEREIYVPTFTHPLIRTAQYYPQADGLIKRFNKTLKSVMKRVASEEEQDWNTLLPCIPFAYREIPQAATGFSHFELVFG